MSASQNNMTFTLNQQDSSGVNILNRTIGPVSYAGAVGVFTDGIFPDNSSHVQALPTTNVLQFYFKNTHSTAVVTVTWTLQGGASQSILKCQPGQVIVFWSPVTSGTAGITALTLQSDTALANFEMYLAG